MSNLDILAETNHWIAINKPPSLIVEHNPFESSLEDKVLEYLQKTTKKPFLGIVHRLDRVTSGVIIMAKKKSTLKDLNEQFRLKKIHKTYLAIVDKKPVPPTSRLNHFLLKDKPNKRAIIFKNPTKNAQECSLTYHTLKSIEDAHLLSVKPKTGKFHQIRAQLSHIGCPIIGDEKYGSSISYLKNGIALHAQKIIFYDGYQNQKIEIEAPLPNLPIWKKM